MFEVIKNAVHMDAHMYEINKEKLKKVYNISTKPKREYDIVEKKVIYAKDDKKVFHNKEDLERNYFSNYKFFREYLTSGFESEETKQELQEIKHLIENSKNLREYLMKHFEIEVEEHTTEHHNNNPLKMFNNMNNLNENESVVSHAQSNTGTLLKKTKFFNNFAKMCNLLQLKGNNNKTENASVFKLYSELNNPSDVYSFSINENFLSSKLLGFKKKLTRSYYQEEFFSNFAKNYFGRSPENVNNSQIDQIPAEIRQKFPVDYIDSIFRPRESEVFYQIDSFMSNYGITQKAHLYEKDLYENIYGILSKCNYANFMSYLYSKNNLFKYIYDEFALKRGALSESLENVNLSRIDSMDTTDKFFRGGELLTSPKIINMPNRRNTLSSRMSPNIDEYLANYFLDKICFLSEKIDEKIAEPLIKDNSLINNVHSQLIKNTLQTMFKNIMNKDFSYLILLSRNEKLKIINYDGEHDPNRNDIDEDIKKIQIYKIDKKFLNDKFSGSNTKEPAFKDTFNSVSCFFILEVKKYLNKNENNQKFSLSSGTHLSNYFLFRVTNENIERFELAVNQLKLYLKYEERNVQIPANESFASVNNLLPTTEPSKPPRDRDVSGLKDSGEDKKVKDESKSKKIVPRVSQYDEDFLGGSNNDILNEVLYNKHVKKDGGVAFSNLKNKAMTSDSKIFKIISYYLNF